MADKKYKYPFLATMSKKVYKTLSEEITKSFQALSGSTEEVCIVQTQTIPMTLDSNVSLKVKEIKEYEKIFIQTFEEAGYFDISLEWDKHNAG